MWIEPELDVGSSHCSSATSFFGSLVAAIVTGSSNAEHDYVSWPRSNARRHLKTWLAFKPCARATSATLAPSSIVNCTI